MTGIAKFILQIMILLASFSVVGVAGCMLIVGLSSEPLPGCFGWVFLCAVGYLFCADLLTVKGIKP